MRGIGPEAIVLLVLVLIAVAVVVWFFALSPAAKNRRKMQERMKTLNKKKLSGSATSSTPGVQLRRDEGRTALDNLARRLLPNPEILRAKLHATGKNMSIGKLFAMSVAFGVAGAVAFLYFTDLPSILALPAGIGASVFFPSYLLKRWIGQRQAEFTASLPEALDMIVRGVKSGLPVAETIIVVSEEMDGVIAVEFQRVAEDARIGMTLEAALWSSALRLDVPEFKFFVVVLTVQRETGGNLAETLENLCELVRSRRQMKLKIVALSSEARASQYILGGLPFAIAGLLMLIAPDYILTLFRVEAGHTILMVGGVMMFLGWTIMGKMVNFDV